MFIMLRSKHKLNSVQFVALYQSGSYIHSNYAMVKYAPSLDGVFRAAVAVSKKHAGNAVVRNVYRRIGYEVIRDYVHTQDYPAVQLIVQIKKPAFTVSKEVLVQDTEMLLKKVPLSPTIKICKK